MSAAEEPLLVIYGAPLVGVLLVAFGIAGGVLGGYAIVQEQLDLCGEPTVSVASQAATERLTSGSDAPSLARLDAEELTPAERDAVRRGLSNPRGEAVVRGPFPHRAAFERGALVTVDGTTRYVALSSDNECLDVDPLLFPLGVFGILLGFGGILTPPLYRRLVAFDERTS